MPPRTVTDRYTLSDAIEGVRAAAKEGKYKLDVQALQGISAWDLYRAARFVTNINRLAVDGPVNFALRTVGTDPYRVRELARIMLGRGDVLFKESADPDTGQRIFEVEEPDDIMYVGWRRRLGKLDEVREVIIRYEYEEPLAGQTTPPPMLSLHPTVGESATETWVYYARYYYTYVDTDEGTLLDQPVIDERKFRLTDEEDEAAKGAKPEPLERWPYRGVRWETGESVLEPIKPSILRVEAAWRNIMEENDTHSRRSIIYENVDEVILDKRESNDQGYTQLPAGSKGYYPDMHSEGMDQMFKEYEMAMEEIREYVGNIRVKELHNASGPSRTFEVFPNIAFANVIRDKVREMVQILDPNATLDLGPLLDYTPQEIILMQKVYTAMQMQGSMDDTEYVNKMRLITNLPERQDLKLKPAALPVILQSAGQNKGAQA